MLEQAEKKNKLDLVARTVGRLLLNFFHSVQCTSCFKPFDLGLIKRVIQCDCVARAVRVLKNASQRLKKSKSYELR